MRCLLGESPLQPAFVTPSDHLFRLQNSEQPFAYDFDEPATHKVSDHSQRQSDFELRIHVCQSKIAEEVDESTYEVFHLHYLKPARKLGDEVGRSRECNSTCAHEAPEEIGILSDPFPERPTLEVDRESRDLLREPEKIDCSIEKIWFELRLQVNGTTASQ